MNKKILSMLLIGLAPFTRAQEMTSTQGPEMADAMRQDGKIWIVVSVIGLIFLALVIFMIRIERKIKNLEDKLNK